MTRRPDIYGGRDPVDLPRYSYREASKATDVPATTIASWFRGQVWYGRSGPGLFRPVLQRPDRRDSRLSFNNLLEVHILRALRRVHAVRLDSVRQAIQRATEEFKVPRLLLSNQLHAGGGELFLEIYSDLVHLSRSRQIIMKEVFTSYLQRITVEDAHADIFPFYPFPKSPDRGSQKLILISPHVAFGAAVVSRTGVTTSTIARRLDSGEDRAVIVEDYGLQEAELEEAVLYELAA